MTRLLVVALAVLGLTACTNDTEDDVSKVCTPLVSTEL